MFYNFWLYFQIEYLVSAKQLDLALAESSKLLNVLEHLKNLPTFAEKASEACVNRANIYIKVIWEQILVYFSLLHYLGAGHLNKFCRRLSFFSSSCDCSSLLEPGNTHRWGMITVQLVSSLTGLNLTVSVNTSKIFSSFLKFKQLILETIQTVFLPLWQGCQPSPEPGNKIVFFRY